jgi:hypothetical protein
LRGRLSRSKAPFPIRRLDRRHMLARVIWSRHLLHYKLDFSYEVDFGSLDDVVSLQCFNIGGELRVRLNILPFAICGRRASWHIPAAMVRA